MLDSGKIDGGKVIAGTDGKPTGILVDEAMQPMYKVLPAIDATRASEALTRALALLASNGLTGVHDMGVTRRELALFRQFADDGRLTLRIDAYADGDREALADLCKDGLYHHPGGRLEMQGVKLYIDGALGSRGAALLSDYSDEPGNRGLLVTAPDAYEAAVRKAKGCGVQVATHAIGDRGNRLVLDTYERVLGDDAKTDHRWRVEHAQILSPEDLGRFAKLGVIASMQPTHATSDMPWAKERARRSASGRCVCLAQPARYRRTPRVGFRLPGGVVGSTPGVVCGGDAPGSRRPSARRLVPGPAHDGNRSAAAASPPMPHGRASTRIAWADLRRASERISWCLPKIR